MSNNSNNKTLSGAITLGQSGPGSDPQSSSSITGASSSYCLVPYQGYLLQEPYTSAEMQSAYSSSQSWLGHTVRKFFDYYEHFKNRFHGLHPTVKPFNSIYGLKLYTNLQKHLNTIANFSYNLRQKKKNSVIEKFQPTLDKIWTIHIHRNEYTERERERERESSCLLNSKPI